MNDLFPLGESVPNWAPPPRPSGEVLQGHYARLEPLDAERHAALLFRAFEGHDDRWTYMPYGPFHSSAQFHRWVRETVARPEHRFYAIQDRGEAGFSGVASFLRVKPEAGSIEVGNINFAPALAGSRAATEAMYLMMRWVFEAGYRRYEWKCNALNRPSRRAAQRLGFSFEGVFRQAMVVKGRNRDTAWFACIDKEWPALQEAFAAWLSPGNFDADGRQKERLSDLTRLVRPGSDPTV